jgi:hypothetical protein
VPQQPGASFRNPKNLSKNSGHLQTLLFAAHLGSVISTEPVFFRVCIRHVISTEGGASCAAVERPLYFALPYIVICPLPSVVACPILPLWLLRRRPIQLRFLRLLRPEWFNGGVFIGSGRWFHGPANFRGHVDNHYHAEHGYAGPMPNR